MIGVSVGGGGGGWGAPPPLRIAFIYMHNVCVQYHRIHLY